MLGVTSDCTTRKWPEVGSEVVGEEGRYIFRGMWRNGAPWAYSSRLEIGLNVSESSVRSRISSLAVRRSTMLLEPYVLGLSSTISLNHPLTTT